MQDPNLGQVSLCFFNVVPYGVQLFAPCNLASMIQRGYKAIDAKRRTRGKGISLLYVVAGCHGSILTFAGIALSGASIFLFCPPCRHPPPQTYLGLLKNDPPASLEVLGP